MKSLHGLLRSYGFQWYKAEPTEADYQQYYEVCKLLKRTDIEFTPILNMIYYLPISEFSMLIVEKKVVGEKVRYTRYDFYKERKMNYLGSDTIKVYAEDMKYMDAYYYLKRYLENFEKVRGANEKV